MNNTISYRLQSSYWMIGLQNSHDLSMVLELSYADLAGANLHNADLSRADLSNADLRHADLSNADLRHADLSNAKLINADLSNADLRHADLSNAKLINADLSDADLRNANLSNTNLRYANLSNTNLRYANLSNTNLKNAKLINTNLDNVDLSYSNVVGTGILYIPALNSKRDDNIYASPVWNDGIVIGVTIHMGCYTCNDWDVARHAITERGEYVQYNPKKMLYEKSLDRLRDMWIDVYGYVYKDGDKQ